MEASRDEDPLTARIKELLMQDDDTEKVEQEFEKQDVREEEMQVGSGKGEEKDAGTHEGKNDQLVDEVHNTAEKLIQLSEVASGSGMSDCQGSGACNEVVTACQKMAKQLLEATGKATDKKVGEFLSQGGDLLEVSTDFEKFVTDFEEGKQTKAIESLENFVQTFNDGTEDNVIEKLMDVDRNKESGTAEANEDAESQSEKVAEASSKPEVKAMKKLSDGSLLVAMAQKLGESTEDVVKSLDATVVPTAAAQVAYATPTAQEGQFVVSSTQSNGSLPSSTSVVGLIGLQSILPQGNLMITTTTTMPKSAAKCTRPRVRLMCKDDIKLMVAPERSSPFSTSNTGVAQLRTILPKLSVTVTSAASMEKNTATSATGQMSMRGSQATSAVVLSTATSARPVSVAASALPVSTATSVVAVSTCTSGGNASATLSIPRMKLKSNRNTWTLSKSWKEKGIKRPPALIHPPTETKNCMEHIICGWCQ